jgi:hypothetical protein
MQVSRYFNEQKTFCTDAQILRHQRYGHVYIVRLIIRPLLPQKKTNHKIRHKDINFQNIISYHNS